MEPKPWPPRPKLESQRSSGYYPDLDFMFALLDTESKTTTIKAISAPQSVHRKKIPTSARMGDSVGSGPTRPVTTWQDRHRLGQLARPIPPNTIRSATLGDSRTRRAVRLATGDHFTENSAEQASGSPPCERKCSIFHSSTTAAPGQLQ
jgi:hypothetical protein